MKDLVIVEDDKVTVTQAVVNIAVLPIILVVAIPLVIIGERRGWFWWFRPF